MKFFCPPTQADLAIASQTKPFGSRLTMSQTSTIADISTFQLSDPEKWNHYIRHRPQYPESMFEKWLAYHGENEPLEAVHDLGTGGGVGALAFLNAISKIRGSNPVKTMYLSEPGAENLEAARRNLTSGRFPGVTFKFHRGPGEEPNPDIAPQSLDMVMACECLHFTDIEPTMANIASYLRPGGTFVTIMYLAIPRILNNPSARDLQKKFESKWRVETVRRGNVFDLRKRLQAATALDFVPMDTNLWQEGSVVRWFCNVPNREWAFEELIWDMSPEEIETYKPKRGAHFEKDGGTEKEEVVTDRENWGLRGVTVDKMRDIYAARQPGALDNFPELPEWKALVEEMERVGGKVDVEVPALMILAKRR